MANLHFQAKGDAPWALPPPFSILLTRQIQEIHYGSASVYYDKNIASQSMPNWPKFQPFRPQVNIDLEPGHE
jgi:hypothetical protein